MEKPTDLARQSRHGRDFSMDGLCITCGRLAGVSMIAPRRAPQAARDTAREKDCISPHGWRANRPHVKDKRFVCCNGLKRRLAKVIASMLSAMWPAVDRLPLEDRVVVASAELTLKTWAGWPPTRTSTVLPYLQRSGDCQRGPIIATVWIHTAETVQVIVVHGT